MPLIRRGGLLLRSSRPVAPGAEAEIEWTCSERVHFYGLRLMDAPSAGFELVQITMRAIEEDQATEQLVAPVPAVVVGHPPLDMGELREVLALGAGQSGRLVDLPVCKAVGGKILGISGPPCKLDIGIVPEGVVVALRVRHLLAAAKPDAVAVEFGALLFAHRVVPSAGPPTGMRCVS